MRVRERRKSKSEGERERGRDRDRVKVRERRGEERREEAGWMGEMRKEFMFFRVNFPVQKKN